MADDTTARAAEVLSSAAYEEAFRKAASGGEATLSEDERGLLRQARELTGTPAPGYPMPARYDATRNPADRA
jgi:hypothetical protein